ncbi:MAG: hypothetical protein IKM90_04500 [Bacteroidaceae bacterium]|nr:hypothetical protein [Bacteroidaceae bacterium]
MRKFAFVLLLTLATVAGQAQSTVIKVSMDNAIQTNGGYWEGWGTSLCWWANRVGYNETLTQKSADLFFDAQKGLGLNIMRYNVGGGDDPTHHHITRTDSDVPGWMYIDANGERKYDYTADARQLNVVKAAMKAAGQDAYLEIFSNSPPYFMTNSGCSTGNFKAEENNIKDDEYDDFAEYMAHVANYMTREMKLKVKSVSPMNEPNTNYWPAMNYKQEGCHIDAGEAQSKLLVLTKEALGRYGLNDIVLTTSDETNPGKQIEEIKTLTPDARAAINRISVHTYGVNSIREMGQLAKDEKINLWMSEVDGNGTAGQNAGEMAAGLWLAEKIINDIEALEPSAWVLWQVIDTHISKEGYKGRRDGGPLRTQGGYWGTACANHDTGEILLTQKYYAFGQFSRYIRPGSQLILCPTDRRSGIKALAAIDSKHKQLTIVLTNTTNQEKDMTIDMSEFKLKGNVKQIRTSGQFQDGEHWSETDLGKIKDSKLEVTLIPNSVTTFLVRTK